MFNVSKERLSAKELERLHTFLTTPFENATPMSLTQAHGFFCAVISAPHLIMPSKWQPVLMGGMPEFSSLEEAQEIIGLLMNFNNYVSSQLRGETPFEFILWEKDSLVSLEDASDKVVTEWCTGYLAGTTLDDWWYIDNQAVVMLFPFAVLADQINITGEHDPEGNVITDDKKHKANYKKQLAKYVLENYKHWLEACRYVEPLYGSQEPVRSNKIGRNDPCPCGSGKKYKKCCWSTSETLH